MMVMVVTLHNGLVSRFLHHGRLGTPGHTLAQLVIALIASPSQIITNIL